MRLFFELNRYLLKYKWKIIWGVLCIIVSKVFSIYPAQLIRQSFDYIENSVSNYELLKGTWFANTYLEHLFFVVLVYVVLVIISALLNGFFLFLTRQTIIVVSRHIEYDMKNEIFEKYQKLGFSFYKQNSTGDLMNRISEDVGRVRMYFGPAIMYSTNLFFLFIMVISTMIQVNPTLTLYSLIPLPILAVTIYFVSDILHKKSEVVQKKLSDITVLAQESFSGIRILKSYNRQTYFERLFSKETDQYVKESMNLTKVDAVFHPVMTLLIGLSTILTIYVGGILHVKGEVTLGNIAEFVIYVNMLTWPVASIGWVTSLTQRAMASYARMREFLDVPVDIKEPEHPKPFVAGDIEFKNVSYTYPETNIKAIQNLSFYIPRGKTIGIVGKTGSGKSTIGYLLCRFLDPQSGKLTIHGTPLYDIALSDLRNVIGYVPQDVFLFSDTIQNNIAFSLPQDHVELEVKIKAAIQAHVHQNIEEFPQKYDTLLGERGINLSGGQKQRISIARGIIKNPQILIFDDCLSAVDMETEEIIIRNLKDVMKDKTAIIISQRISSVKHAHEILVLEEGQVVERGNHEYLMQQQGYYYDLYQQQGKQTI